MRKRTAFQTPEDRKASPNQTKGLVAEGKKTRRSGLERCALDNRSHRTLQKLLNRPTNTPFPGPSPVTTEIEFPRSAWLGPVGSEAAGGGRRQQLF